MQEENIAENAALTVGEMLREARGKKNLSLEAVAAELCIRQVYLEAIENMDFKNIPPVPYDLGFIRSYAEFLGLNSERVVSAYKRAAAVNGAREDYVDESFENEPTGPKLRHIIFGFVGLAVLGGIFAWQTMEKPWGDWDDIVNISTEDEATVPEPVIIAAPAEQAEVVAQEPVAAEPAVAIEAAPQAPVAVEEPQAEEKAEPAAPVPASRIKMVLVGQTWLELTQNGKILLSGIRKKGFTYDVPNAPNMRVSIGKHNNVKFYIDGQETKVVTAANRRKVLLDRFLTKKK